MQETKTTAVVTSAIPDEDSTLPRETQHRVSLYRNEVNYISLNGEVETFYGSILTLKP